MKTFKEFKYKSGVYISWYAMKQRCSNPNNKKFKEYGGRGISFCERWNIFNNFFIDMGDRPKGFELERINNNGNYEPSNCKWASKSEQRSNRRKYGKLKFFGVSNSKHSGYQAQLWDKIKKTTIQLGCYENETDAAQAYDCAAFLYFKDRRFRNREIMESQYE